MLISLGAPFMPTLPPRLQSRFAGKAKLPGDDAAAAGNGERSKRIRPSQAKGWRVQGTFFERSRFDIKFPYRSLVPIMPPVLSETERREAYNASSPEHTVTLNDGTCWTLRGRLDTERGRTIVILAERQSTEATTAQHGFFRLKSKDLWAPPRFDETENDSHGWPKPLEEAEQVAISEPQAKALVAAWLTDLHQAHIASIRAKHADLLAAADAEGRHSKGPKRKL